MAGEGEVRTPDPGAVRSPGSVPAGPVKVGLVAAPDIPEKSARELDSELPHLLGRQVDERVSWKVSVVVDPLTGAEWESAAGVERGFL